MSNIIKYSQSATKKCPPTNETTCGECFGIMQQTTGPSNNFQRIYAFNCPACPDLNAPNIFISQNTKYNPIVIIFEIPPGTDITSGNIRYDTRLNTYQATISFSNCQGKQFVNMMSPTTKNTMLSFDFTYTDKSQNCRLYNYSIIINKTTGNFENVSVSNVDQYTQSQKVYNLDFSSKINNNGNILTTLRVPDKSSINEVEVYYDGNYTNKNNTSNIKVCYDTKFKTQNMTIVTKEGRKFKLKFNDGYIVDINS
jgi:hypothetical protein